MTVVLLRCENCGAEPRLDVSLVTLVIDLTTELASARASVPFVCPLCGTAGESCWISHEVQTMLLDGGASLAATP